MLGIRTGCTRICIPSLYGPYLYNGQLYTVDDSDPSNLRLFAFNGAEITNDNFFTRL